MMASGEKLYGSRYLENSADVFQHNAWDDVEWSDELQEAAAKKVATNSKSILDEETQARYEDEASTMWDKFYGIHQNRFFKDRQWLFKEFPELVGGDMTGAASAVTQETPVSTGEASEAERTESASQECSDATSVAAAASDAGDVAAASSMSTPGGPHRILEVGCGVGNTVFPLLRSNNDPSLFIYCCDFSSTAIDIVKSQAEYDSGRCHAFVCDISDVDAAYPMEDGSLDVITVIFVLSALQPCKMEGSIRRLAKLLKPGGLLLFRDYGHYDMAQLRFKTGHCLGENFYVRGDGTRCYFFKQDELHELFTRAGLERVQNAVDRRLQVNRGRQLQMYRVWIQCKYRKVAHSSPMDPS